jgi:hypothetical protein
MTTAVFESPTHGSQLFFDWMQPDSGGTAPATRSAESVARQSLAGLVAAATTRSEAAAYLAPPAQAGNKAESRLQGSDRPTHRLGSDRPAHDSQSESAPTEPQRGQETQPVKLLSQLPEFRRGGGEIRIGSVMIRLLKSYGITDAEIAEGVANYARKTCHSQAS